MRPEATCRSCASNLLASGRTITLATVMNTIPRFATLSLLVLTACAPPQLPEEAAAPEQPVVPGQACPDLDGQFVIRNAPELLLPLMPDTPMGFQPDFLVLASDRDHAQYTWTAAYESGRWLGEVERFRARDPEAYATWHAAMLAGSSHGDAAVDAPPPEQHLSRERGDCVDHWMRFGVVDLREGMVQGIDGDHEVTLWFGRRADGALLVRYDAVRLLDLWITGKPIRMSRTTVLRAFPEIRGTPATIAQLPLPTPPVPELTPEELVQAFTALEARVRGLMPEGMDLDRFTLDDQDNAIARGNGRLRLSGTARRNADVSTFMRALDQQDDLDRVELLSIAVQEGRMRFDLQVDWRSPRGP